MAAFFIVNIEIPDNNARNSYDEYIAKVKPVVESYGGGYIVAVNVFRFLQARTNRIE